MVVDLPFFMGTLLPPLAGTGTRSGTIPGEGCLVIFFFKVQCLCIVWERQRMKVSWVRSRKCKSVSSNCLKQKVWKGGLVLVMSFVSLAQAESWEGERSSPWHSLFSFINFDFSLSLSLSHSGCT